MIDAYARRIIGWRAARSMTTPLVLDALEHAFFTRARKGVTNLDGLIAHNDAGSVGGFKRSWQHLDEVGAADGHTTGLDDDADWAAGAALPGAASDAA